jgi:hypothetical protein
MASDTSDSSFISGHRLLRYARHAPRRRCAAPAPRPAPGVIVSHLRQPSPSINLLYDCAVIGNATRRGASGLPTASRLPGLRRRAGRLLPCDAGLAKFPEAEQRRYRVKLGPAAAPGPSPPPRNRVRTATGRSAPPTPPRRTTSGRLRAPHDIVTLLRQNDTAAAQLHAEAAAGENQESGALLARHPLRSLATSRSISSSSRPASRATSRLCSPRPGAWSGSSRPLPSGPKRIG